ncbi:FecR domain-containing protein [Singulisphaera acidiphila]|uniref:FecR protein n=1 Tax=Singulisphaera acidiphila (strain ATCC BAA-1392 / DSM 18658 / VKM B-2454 / MOB10) TaxID=886293 RepID=L0DLW6_SINAD|nr:FecR domain-containing protein [Singulisphaera acidiphila]AGA29838.1 FecR protein [Singulisphaera acidiphila DSM 18658]
MNGRWDELQELCEIAIEGQLTVDSAARLESLVLSDPAARRFYVQYLHQHASLHWAAAEPAFMPATLPLVGENSSTSKISEEVPRRGLWQTTRIAGLAAAALLLGVGIGWYPWRVRPPLTVATLAEAKACKWDGGSLPTVPGAKLPAGRLRLAEGLAKITFANGAEITLEAPADLELVSPKHCVLHAGRLVAKVPPNAIGFTVKTPTALIEDLGTAFGVNVLKGKSADVQVFEGLVDVHHVGSGRLAHMRTGENLRFSPNSFAKFNPMAERPSADRDVKWSDAATRLLQISTATGQGKDAYIRRPIPMGNGPEALLLVKNTVQDDYARKAYLGMDLAPIAGLKVVDATLSLTFAPSELGFASEVPDATFGVYGLTDESLDGWGEDSIRWDNAPANLPGGAALDLDKVVPLGQFEIMQGVLSGTRSISGQALADFLNQDTNGMATLIIIRETKGSGRMDLVHGFAGKHHPQLLPPTLKLTAVPRPKP